MKFSFNLICMTLLFSLSTFAQIKKVENEKSVKTKVVDKADEVITNRLFRASNGSLSKFSLNMGISYNGGSLEKPFAADRPNISNAGDTTSIAGISGSFNGSYRLNALNRINAGAGIQMLAPFNDSIDTDDARAEKEFDENKGELDISNPYIGYTYMNKFLGVQTILSATLTEFTAGDRTAIGYKNSLGGTVNTMYNIKDSGFSFGALLLYTKYIFDKDDSEFLASQNDVVFGFLPQAEYIINDTFNLRTIIRSHWYQNNNADRDFTRRAVTQSVGLGISVNRDVFLYPNIQFVLEDMTAAKTNIGFTANINMF